jgi:hypothetical protein
MNNYTDEKQGLPAYTKVAETQAPKVEASSSSTSAFQSQFASISLHQSDRIRFLQFPAEHTAAIRSVVARNWPFGIQAERPYGGSHEIKLRGNPWSGQGSDAIPARIMMRELFAYLFSVGWIIHQTVDLSKKKFDKDTIVFRKQPTAPPSSSWIALSFNQADRLRLIGASTELIAAFRTMLLGMKMHQSSGWKDQAMNAWEFKINGYPWMPSGEETMTMRLLVLRMLETLEKNGWSLYVSVDQNNGPSNSDTNETDSWYCVRAHDWVPGNPVFHR